MVGPVRGPARPGQNAESQGEGRHDAQNNAEVRQPKPIQIVDGQVRERCQDRMALLCNPMFSKLCDLLDLWQFCLFACCSEGPRATRTLTPSAVVVPLASLSGVFSLATKPSSPTLPVLRPSLLPPPAMTMEQGRPHAILSPCILLSI